MTSRQQKGFTLIELMIVVAIIGILAAVAIPAYSDYMKRSKVAEAMQLLGGLKTGATEWYNDKNLWPTAASITSVTKGKYVSMISNVAGKSAFSAAMKDTDISGPAFEKILILFYSTPTGIWKCDAAIAGTTIDAKYLPSACR